VLELRPGFAEAHNNLGVALKDLGQLDAALASYRKAVELKPNYAEAHNNLGTVLQTLGQPDAALSSYRRAVEIEPDFAEAHFNLGDVLRSLGHLDGAEASYHRALKIKPDYVSAHINLGNIYKDTGRLDEAIASYRRAVPLDSKDTRAHRNLIYALYFHPDFDDRMILAEAKKFASSLNATPPSVSSYACRNNLSERRLRIGYVSPDFRNHCQSFFTIPLLSNHDHAQFEIYCYAELAQPDDISKRLRTYCDVWRNTHLKSDQQVAEMIVNDGIDILIDLTMHMAKGRPRLFALKPAPIQIAWLAYPGTTGLPAIGYRLTDPWLDPPGIGDDHYTEISIRLPETFWCYDPLVSDLQPNILPALTAGYVTFGCLNNFCKVSDDTLCRWGEVMSRVPSSRLILLAPAGRHRQRIFDILGRYDVAAERIEIVELQPRFQYLQTYHRIDIGLDTLPYNGHTTSLDAYWMGVPIVTQVGHTVVGRAGWSQLNNLGLTGLAAFDNQTFVDIAVALATDLSRLSQLRQTLRSNLEASPLMDGKRFAKAIETAYSQIWQSSQHFGVR
jgi:protein O-GlcNAc transferase